MNNLAYVGKTLYNASGHKIGIITDVIIFHKIECFVIGAMSENQSPGRYWQTDRLDSGKSDQITINCSESSVENSIDDVDF